MVKGHGKIFVWLLAIAAMASTVTPAAAITSVGRWDEVGDAGGTDDPQGTTGPAPHAPLSFIHGDIGGEDTFDVFTIFVTEPGDESELLPANPFEAIVSFDDEGPSLILELFDEGGRSILAGDGSVRVADLSPGIYHIGVFTDIAVDPPFTIEFLTPNVEFFLPLANVPEPGMTGLLAAGLGALRVFKRRGKK